MAADWMYPDMSTCTGRRLRVPKGKCVDAGIYHAFLWDARCHDDWRHGIRSFGSRSGRDSVPVGRRFLWMGDPAMTLTEEQRAALKRVVAYMDEMYAIASPYHGCTEDANILRAMIDSSEHFTDATKMIGFDLERARGFRDFLQDDCAEVGDVWAEMIAEIERLREALDKSEQILAHKTKTSTHWYEEGLQTRADLVQCKRVVEQQAARIEELGADLEQSEICIRARLDVIDQQAAKIKELEANCIYDPETGKVFVPDGHPELEKLRARNRDLEDALVEDLARDIAYDGGILWSVRRSKQDEYRKIARDQLRIEGKIGPDAKPHCWQITEERILSIENAISSCVLIERYTGQDLQHETAVLRAMLKEAA